MGSEVCCGVIDGSRENSRKIATDGWRTHYYGGEKRPLVSLFGFCCHKLPTLYGFLGRRVKKMMKGWHTPYAFHLGDVS